MCTVLLPPGVNPIAVNKYIISYRIFLSVISITIIQCSHPKGIKLEMSQQIKKFYKLVRGIKPKKALKK
jgi:hypothetical protein